MFFRSGRSKTALETLAEKLYADADRTVCMAESGIVAFDSWLLYPHERQSPATSPTNRLKRIKDGLQIGFEYLEGTTNSLVINAKSVSNRSFTNQSPCKRLQYNNETYLFYRHVHTQWRKIFARAIGLTVGANPLVRRVGRLR